MDPVWRFYSDLERQGTPKQCEERSCVLHEVGVSDPICSECSEAQ
eukprot:SAG11_NODE_12217_length_715_cov_0.918831_1_plen_44_part_10